MANQAVRADRSTAGITRQLAENSASMGYEGLPEEVTTVAKHCLLDWLGVTIAGTRTATGRMVLDEAIADGGSPQATLLGVGVMGSASQAAQVNGTCSHALDFDDVNYALMGHPTVPVMPAVLALAERDARSGGECISAFVAGVETECRIGLLLGRSHYSAGWHATGTLGTFGAAAASARLLGLDAETSAVAMGIAGTQAAGLKSMFGTMCKPLHAGKAAANGLYAALLAKRGFTATPEVLECVQGFADTHHATIDPDAALDGLGRTFHTQNALFKYHAACYGTHATIDGINKLRAEFGIEPSKVEKVELRVPTANLKMCNIQEPSSGLEAKFSLRLAAAMALDGVDTGSIETYDEAICAEPRLVSLRDKVRVVGDDDLTHATSDVVVSLADGVVLRQSADMSIPERNLEHQWKRLQQKFTSLAAPIIGDDNARSVTELVERFDQLDDVSELTEHCAG